MEGIDAHVTAEGDTGADHGFRPTFLDAAADITPEFKLVSDPSSQLSKSVWEQFLQRSRPRTREYRMTSFCAPSF